MTRLLFLTGPGGAGTTTLAAATALRAAAEGHRVLLLGVADAGELAQVLGASGVSGDGNVLDVDEEDGAPPEVGAALANLTVRRFDPSAATENALVELARFLSGPLAAAGLSAPDATELGPVPGLPDILALR
ncbi:MAG: hypothetical protein HOV83_31990, partial [Catenulispora sp.]|nr:hypothetical protein [Catenulispora sp.]